MFASRIAAATLLVLVLAPAAGADEPDCLTGAGGAAHRCLQRHTLTVERCRRGESSDCETAARAEGGALEQLVAAGAASGAGACTDATAQGLGFLDADDVELRVADACRDFSEDLLASAYGRSDGLTRREWLCQRQLVRDLTRVRAAVVRVHGRECNVGGYLGRPCDRPRRDRIVEGMRRRAVHELARNCGAALVSLGIPGFAPPAEARPALEALFAQTTTRARHFAQLAYPPNDFGADANFGRYPVGIRTLELVDPSRPSADGKGNRPVTVEVYYPTTIAAIDGVPRDVASVLGIPLIETPAFRDVAIAAGPFPLVLFSHGNNGIRIQSFYFGAHLASHGYIVASPDHHGNTFVDTLGGIVDANVVNNRPRDMSFVLDELLARNAAPGNFYSGTIIPEQIGMSGHSFGGFTTFAMAGGATRDARIKALFPQAPAAVFMDEYFSAIDLPTLIVGGSIDETTGFAENQLRPFTALPSGAAVVGLAELRDGGHFTFSDFCEVPRELLSFLGGFDEACEPRHLPWRHAHDIINLLALRFFDATLRGDGEALALLDPEVLAGIEDLTYTSK